MAEDGKFGEQIIVNLRIRPSKATTGASIFVLADDPHVGALPVSQICFVYSCDAI